MLQDLETVVEDIRAKIGLIPLDVAFCPSADLWKILLDCYPASTNDNVQVAGNALIIKTPKDSFLTISAQELPRLLEMVPYARALRAYEDKVEELAHALGYASPQSSPAKTGLFKLLPTENWRDILQPDLVRRIEEAVALSLDLSTTEQQLFLRFLGDKQWSRVTKKLDRRDWVEGAIPIAGGCLSAASARRGELVLALLVSSNLQDEMKSEFSTALENGSATNNLTPVQRLVPGKIGVNELIYGAPGTGKSYSIDEDLKGCSVVRTVFHPDMQNSDFFGSLKPKMNGDKVAYAFSPGPFAKALNAAYKNPQEHHYLVIEELNRAPAAAVFGELFQLLDRDGNGESRYEVDLPSDDAAAWFDREKIKLPSNLTLLATMNSADQGVFPLDTAFRRRWAQRYFPLYGDLEKYPQGSLTLSADGGEFSLEWRHFVKSINDNLSQLGTAEDRLMGIWFAQESELGGPIPIKVLIYLWDDVLRHQNRNAIFSDTLHTFGDINDALSKHKPVLASGVLASLKAIATQLETVKSAADNDDDGADDADPVNPISLGDEVASLVVDKISADEG